MLLQIFVEGGQVSISKLVEQQSFMVISGPHN